MYYIYVYYFLMQVSLGINLAFQPYYINLDLRGTSESGRRHAHCETSGSVIIEDTTPNTIPSIVIIYSYYV